MFTFLSCAVFTWRATRRDNTHVLLSCGRWCCCINRREGIYLISTFLALKICRVYLLLELSMELKLETVSVGSTAPISLLWNVFSHVSLLNLANGGR